MALQKIMAFYNEKGNIQAGTRTAIKSKVSKKLESILPKHFTNGVVLGADGSFYAPLAVAHNDKVIYAKIDLTITDKEPSTEKPSKKSKKDEDDLEID